MILFQEGFFDEKIPSGLAKGEFIDEKEFNRTLSEYYTLKGWDSATGRQKRKTLETLDLKDIADDLESTGKLAS